MSVEKLALPLALPRIHAGSPSSAETSNDKLYGDLSDRVMSSLESFTDQFDCSANEDLNALGRAMRRQVQRDTGIPVSVGFVFVRLDGRSYARSASGGNVLRQPRR